MPCSRAARTALIAVVMVASAPPASLAQTWNDPRTTELVGRATALRARQMADTGLADYSATALGSLTFLAQAGEGFPDPPKVVKADQIALEVYWRAPDSSKQLILGRRDTLLLPTDIQYHRDHLGIVQNNFPSMIRLGEGDEVRDVPHPLSPAGQAAYDFAIRDSLRISIPGRVIDVYEVQFRPRDASKAAAVGALYLTRDDAQVARMAFSFTRAALIDPQLEDVAIVLSNALIEERFWLPQHQDIEIRRSATWLDFPVRGVIRGSWDICCYRINQGRSTVTFTGPEIQLAPPERRARFQFEGNTGSIVPPELATATPEDIERVQAQARTLVAQGALRRGLDDAVLAPSLSQLVRVNRTEGLSLGLGVRRRIAGSFSVSIFGRYGFADRIPRGSTAIAWQDGKGSKVELRVFRELRDASLVAEVSGIRNSLSTQEFGMDATEPFEAAGGELRFVHQAFGGRGMSFSLSLAREVSDSTPVHARAARGSFRPVLQVPREWGWRWDSELGVLPRPWLGGNFNANIGLRVRRREVAGEADFPARLTAVVRWMRPVGRNRLISESMLGVSGSSLPQDSILAGGPITGPGYEVHGFRSSRLLAQRLEWQSPMGFPSFPLGRWGRTPGEARLAMYGSVVVSRGDGGETRTWPSVGIGLLSFFDLVRFDVAWGLRDGRWRFGVDLTRDLWRIL